MAFIISKLLKLLLYNIPKVKHQKPNLNKIYIDGSFSICGGIATTGLFLEGFNEMMNGIPPSLND